MDMSARATELIPAQVSSAGPRTASGLLHSGVRQVEPYFFGRLNRFTLLLETLILILMLMRAWQMPFRDIWPIIRKPD